MMTRLNEIVLDLIDGLTDRQTDRPYKIDARMHIVSLVYLLCHLLISLDFDEVSGMWREVPR